MKSVLDISVSIFANYRSPDNPKSVNLLVWLTSAKYKKEVEKIRQIEDKSSRDKLKAKLPAITASGIFLRRETKGLIQHSKLIAIDIDGKDNQHIGNFSDLKNELCKIKNVAYCGLSVSGAGYFVIIPIAYPERHQQHFDALKEDFARFHIHIDQSCRNVDRLRGYSYDREAYFNHTAKVYRRYIEPQQERYQSSPQQYPQTDESVKVKAILSQIESGRIDITCTYADWFAIGCALANEFGEAGRDYFHRVSQFHAKYSVDATDKQFNHCKRGNGFTIATFYQMSEQYGLYYKHHLRVA